MSTSDLCALFGYVLGYMILCWVIWLCVGLCDYVLGYVIMCWVIWLCYAIVCWVMLYVWLCYYVLGCDDYVLGWTVKGVFKCMSAVICLALSARMCLLLLHDTMLNEVWECAKMTCHDATCWWMVLSPPETVIFNQVAELESVKPVLLTLLKSQMVGWCLIWSSSFSSDSTPAHQVS